MQVEIHNELPHIATSMPRIRRLPIPSVAKNMKQASTVVGMYVYAATLEKHLQFLYKLHVHLPYHLRPPRWLGNKRVHVCTTCTNLIFLFEADCRCLKYSTQHLPQHSPCLPSNTPWWHRQQGAVQVVDSSGLCPCVLGTRA